MTTNHNDWPAQRARFEAIVASAQEAIPGCRGPLVMWTVHDAAALRAALARIDYLSRFVATCGCGGLGEPAAPFDGVSFRCQKCGRHWTVLPCVTADEMQARIEALEAACEAAEAKILGKGGYAESLEAAAKRILDAESRLAAVRSLLGDGDRQNAMLGRVARSRPGDDAYTDGAIDMQDALLAEIRRAAAGGEEPTR